MENLTELQESLGIVVEGQGLLMGIEHPSLTLNVLRRFLKMKMKYFSFLISCIVQQSAVRADESPETLETAKQHCEDWFVNQRAGKYFY